MARYTLRQLEFAIAAHSSGSIFETARAFGVAQSSVSAAIAKLEDQIGVQLFIRHHAQGVVPTPAGRRFLAIARDLVVQANNLQQEAQSLGSAIEGALAVGSFATLAPAFIPRIIAGFRRHYPKVQFRLEEGAQEQLLSGLKDGRYDVAIIYDVDAPDGVALRELATLPPYLLLPASHRLARRKDVALAEVADESFVLLDVLPSRIYFLNVLAAARIRPQIAFASPSIEMVRGLVGQGLGYSILITRPFGDHAYDGRRLALRRIKDSVEPGRIALATAVGVRKTKLVEVFEDYCVRFFGENGTTGV